MLNLINMHVTDQLFSSSLLSTREVGCHIGIQTTLRTQIYRFTEAGWLKSNLGLDLYFTGPELSTCG